MNWKRITVWALLLLLATFVAGFIPGFLRGFYNARHAMPPAWVDILVLVLAPGAMLVIFLLFTRVQRRQTVAHAATLWCVVTAISLGDLALGRPPVQWLIAAVLSGVVSAIGTTIGMLTIPQDNLLNSGGRPKGKR